MRRSVQPPPIGGGKNPNDNRIHHHNLHHHQHPQQPMVPISHPHRFGHSGSTSPRGPVVATSGLQQGQGVSVSGMSTMYTADAIPIKSSRSTRPGLFSGGNGISSSITSSSGPSSQRLSRSAGITLPPSPTSFQRRQGLTRDQGQLEKNMSNHTKETEGGRRISDDKKFRTSRGERSDIFHPQQKRNITTSPVPNLSQMNRSGFRDRDLGTATVGAGIERVPPNLFSLTGNKGRRVGGNPTPPSSARARDIREHHNHHHHSNSENTRTAKNPGFNTSGHSPKDSSLSPRVISKLLSSSTSPTTVDEGGSDSGHSSNNNKRPIWDSTNRLVMKRRKDGDLEDLDNHTTTIPVGVRNILSLSNANHTTGSGISALTRNSIEEKKSYNFNRHNHSNTSGTDEARRPLSSRSGKTAPSTASERHRDIHERYGLDRPFSTVGASGGTSSYTNKRTESSYGNNSRQDQDKLPSPLHSPNKLKTQPNHLQNKQSQQSHPHHHPHRNISGRPSTTATAFNSTSSNSSSTSKQRTPRPSGVSTRGEAGGIHFTEDSRPSNNPHPTSNPSRREHQNQQKNDNTKGLSSSLPADKTKTLLRDIKIQLQASLPGNISTASSLVSTSKKNLESVLSPKNPQHYFSSEGGGSTNNRKECKSSSNSNATATTTRKVEGFVVKEVVTSTDDDDDDDEDDDDEEESDMDDRPPSFGKRSSQSSLENRKINGSNNSANEDKNSNNKCNNNNIANSPDTVGEGDRRATEPFSSSSKTNDCKESNSSQNSKNIASQEPHGDYIHMHEDEEDSKRCSKCKQLSKSHAKQMHKIKGMYAENKHFAMIVAQKRELVEQLQTQVKLLMRENQQLAKMYVSPERGVTTSNSAPNLTSGNDTVAHAGLGFPIAGKSETSPVIPINHVTMEGDSIAINHLKSKKSTPLTPPTILSSIHSLNHHRKVAVSPEHLKEAEEKIKSLAESCEKLTCNLQRKQSEHERMHKFLSDLLYTLNGRGFESVTDTEGNVVDLNRCKGEAYLELKGRDQRQKAPVRRVGGNDYMFKAIIGSQEKMIQNLIAQLESIQRDALLGDKLSSRSRDSGGGGGNEASRVATLEGEMLQLMTLLEGTCQRYPDVFLALREQYHLDNSESTAGKRGSSPRISHQKQDGMVQKILDRCEQLILSHFPIPSYTIGQSTITTNTRDNPGFGYVPILEQSSSGSKSSTRVKSRDGRGHHQQQRATSDAGHGHGLSRRFSEDLATSKSESPRPRSRQSRRTRSGGNSGQSPIRCSSQPIISAEFTQSDDSFNERSGSGTLDNQKRSCPVLVVSSTSSSSKSRLPYTDMNSYSSTGSGTNPSNPRGPDLEKSNSGSSVNRSSNISNNASRIVRAGSVSGSLNDYCRSGRICPYCEASFDPHLTADDIHAHLEQHAFQASISNE